MPYDENMRPLRLARHAVALAALAVAPCACLLTTDLDGLRGGAASDAATADDAPADRAADVRGDAPGPTADGGRDAPGSLDASDAGPSDGGCDANVASDPANCGACGRTCDTKLCVLGACNACGTANENTTATITCPAGLVVRSVVFASYGLPQGTCGAFTKSATCHADTSVSVVESACLGKASCLVVASNEVFGDPCIGEGKSLDVQVACGP